MIRNLWYRFYFLVIFLSSFTYLSLAQKPASNNGYVGYVASGSGVASTNFEGGDLQEFALAAKQLLRPNTLIKTYNDSSLILHFIDGSVIKIFPDSILIIEQIGSFFDDQRRFSFSFELLQGTISAYVSSLTSDYQATISTFIVYPLAGSCFAANLDDSKNLIRLKAGPQDLTLIEGLGLQSVPANHLFVRYERPFAFASRYLVKLSQKLKIVADTIDPELTIYGLHLPASLRNDNNLQILAMGEPHWLLPDAYFQPDKTGSFFINALLPSSSLLTSQDVSYCFEIDDPELIFNYASSKISYGSVVDR